MPLSSFVPARFRERYAFHHTLCQDGLTLELRVKRTMKEEVLPISEWPSLKNDKVWWSIARLLAALDESAGQHIPAVTQIDEAHLHLTHPFVASLSDSEAASLGLPPTTAWVLDY
jgi:hypothetical protein